MTTNIWRLATDCNNDVTLRTPLAYFQDHFVGSPMKANWQPPQVEVRGKQKRLRDFVSWMLSAPVVSHRAKEVLEPLVVPYAEILPLMRLRGTDLYVLNVIALSDCLDEERSEIVYSPDEPTRIMNVLAFAFKGEAVPDWPIFKVASYPNDVFVRESFVDCVRAHGLRGAAFADPNTNPFPLLLQGRSVNIVKGLTE